MDGREGWDGERQGVGQDPSYEGDVQSEIQRIGSSGFDGRRSWLGEAAGTAREEGARLAGLRIGFLEAYIPRLDASRSLLSI